MKYIHDITYQYKQNIFDTIEDYNTNGTNEAQSTLTHNSTHTNTISLAHTHNITHTLSTTVPLHFPLRSVALKKIMELIKELLDLFYR